MSNSALDCEVLVVGAGPTGLIAADLLKRSGVDVRIVEMRAEATRESRAFAVQARTLELMQSMGLADQMLANGVMTTAVQMHVQGKFVGGMNTDRANAPDTPFPYILMIAQSETERILIEDLAALGVEVERGLEATELHQDADGAVATLRDDAGATSTIRCAYIVGADGSRSVVREAANIDFSGGTYAQNFLLADCKVDWPLDHHHFRVFMNGRRTGLFLPLGGSNLSRVMATDLTSDIDDNASTPLPLDLTELQDAFEKSICLPAKLSDPIWVTRYRAHHRAAEKYRAGRFFLAGDAAHIHSPAGGQGMNTGLQDAANLAWKLGAVLRRGADDELLDNYHDERKPVGEMLLRTTGKLFTAAAGQSGWKASIRDLAAKTFLPIVTRASKFHRKGFGNVSERNISYDLSRYVGEGPRWPSEGPRAGERAPNVRINNDLDMFELLKGYQFNIVAFSRLPLSSDESGKVRERLKALTDEFSFAGSHLIARTAFGFDENCIFANGPDVFDCYGVDSAENNQVVYLIRPDNYVAWRMTGFDFDACRRFLKEFGAHATSAQRQIAAE